MARQWTYVADDDPLYLPGAQGAKWKSTLEGCWTHRGCYRGLLFSALTFCVSEPSSSSSSPPTPGSHLQVSVNGSSGLSGIRPLRFSPSTLGFTGCASQGSLAGSRAFVGAPASRSAVGHGLQYLRTVSAEETSAEVNPLEGRIRWTSTGRNSAVDQIFYREIQGTVQCFNCIKQMMLNI